MQREAIAQKWIPSPRKLPLCSAELEHIFLQNSPREAVRLPVAFHNEILISSQQIDLLQIIGGRLRALEVVWWATKSKGERISRDSIKKPAKPKLVQGLIKGTRRHKPSKAKSRKKCSSMRCGYMKNNNNVSAFMMFSSESAWQPRSKK